jgi:hypothetical protein
MTTRLGRNGSKEWIERREAAQFNRSMMVALARQTRGKSARTAGMICDCVAGSYGQGHIPTGKRHPDDRRFS